MSTPAFCGFDTAPYSSGISIPSDIVENVDELTMLNPFQGGPLQELKVDSLQDGSDESQLQAGL